MIGVFGQTIGVVLVNSHLDELDSRYSMLDRAKINRFDYEYHWSNL